MDMHGYGKPMGAMILGAAATVIGSLLTAKAVGDATGVATARSMVDELAELDRAKGLEDGEPGTCE